MDDRAEVDSEKPVCQSLVRVVDRADCKDARVVDQDVQGPKAMFDIVQASAKCRRIAYVNANSERLAIEFDGCVRRQISVEVRNRNSSALACKRSSGS
jgi:hypothetical protein